MSHELPEGWFWYVHQAGKREWFTGSWEVAIYRPRRFWFSKRVAWGAGWTKAEATNRCIDRLGGADLNIVSWRAR